MSKYILKILTQTAEQNILLSSDQTVKIQAEDNVKYQIFNENGELIADPKVSQLGTDDLAVYLDGDNPTLIIEDYYSHYPIQDAQYLSEVLASLATSSKEASWALASEVANIGWSSKVVLYGLGALALLAGGTALALHRSGDGYKVSKQTDENNQTIDPINVTVTLDSVTDDNVINLSESSGNVVISGQFTADQTFTSAVVELDIGGEKIQATVNGNSFSADVSGSLLANNQEIVVTVTVENAQTTGSASQTQQYSVDTELSEPTITINTITSDNIINAQESGETITLSGSVTNVSGSEAKAGDVVTIQIGSTTLTTELDANLEFTVSANGQILSENSKVVGNLTTSDAAGNSVTTTAEKSYEVDTVIAEPTITINTITSDNIINAQESGETITLSGSVTNVSGSEAKAGDVVTIQIGSTTLTTELDVNLEFTVSASGQILSENSKVVVNLTTSDAAGNSVTTTAEKSYEVDTVIAEPTITINTIATDDVINAVESQSSSVTISGQVTNVENSEAKEGDIIQLQIGSLVVEVALDSDLAFSVPVSTIALVNHKTVVATLVTRDEALNSVTTETSRTITVDDQFNLSVSLDQITTDNTVNQTEASDDMVLTGHFTTDDDLKAGSVVIQITINGTNYTADVNETEKTWRLTVAGQALANSQGENSISAQITAQDNAGNENSASAEHTYQVDTVIGKPVVTITSIAEDNIINAEEASGSITIKGLVENIEGDNPVILQCPCSACASGWKSIEATVASDGTFEVSVVVSETSLASAKLKSAERLIKANYTAEDEAGNTSSADEATLNYDLDLYKQIDITKIGNNFSLTPTATTRITGTISHFGAIKQAGSWYDLDVYEEGQNVRLIRFVKVTIGDKTYVTGFDGVSRTFTLDIPNEDLADISGQAISLSFAHTQENGLDHSIYNWVNLMDENNKIITKLTAYSDLVNFRGYIPTAEAFTLESDILVKNGDNDYSIKTISTETTEISGVVNSNVEIGAEIEVKVGDYTTTTQVLADRSFTVFVENSYLQNNTSHVVTASLKESSDVQDSEVYITPTAVSSEFVSQHSEVAVSDRHTDHTQDNYNFFYPIDLIEQKGYALYGFNKNYQVGGTEEPITIKYHLLRSDEISSLPTTTQGMEYAIEGTIQAVEGTFADMFRAAYKKIAEYTNINFVEVDTWQEVDGDLGSLVYVANFNSSYSGSAAMAITGGNVIWNNSVSGTGVGDYNFYNALHEIMHTLNMNHTHNTFSGVERNPETASSTNHVSEADTEFSNMSYWNTYDSYGGYMYPALRDLRVYDLAYLHYRYGVNREHRSGDDVYTFKKYNVLSADADVYIWDGDGIDTFDASAESEGVTVNLTPGSWNYVGTEKHYNFISDTNSVYSPAEYFGLEEGEVSGSLRNSNGNSYNRITSGYAQFKDYIEGQSFIGYGTQIENLIGSNYNDTLTGNNAANQIFGGAGDDTIAGGLGDDFINGGEGNDLMFGGEGNDTYVVDSAGDVVTEEANEGDADHIYSFINYTLDDNVENLTLVGTTANQGTGNELNNLIQGNDVGNTLKGEAGNDTLIGGLGSDTLTGGDGNDIFVFNTTLNGKADTITDFVRGEDKIQLSSNIFTAIATDLSNLAEHLFYDQTSGELRYSSTSGDSDNAIHFVTVTGLESIDANQFILG